MPAPITAGLLNFIQGQLGCSVWDNEVPRFDVAGNPINVDSTTTSPTSWPVVKCSMPESGMKRTSTFADPYSEQGPIKIQVWGVSRQQVEAMLTRIDTLWAEELNWYQVQMTGSPDDHNRFYVIQMLLDTWTCIQEEGVRLYNSSLCYRGDMIFDCMIHGIISTSTGNYF